MNLLGLKKEQLGLYFSILGREARCHPKGPNKLSLGSCQEIDPILNDQFAMCFPPPILFCLIIPNQMKSGKVGLSLLIFLT